jgi:hypothetical protein
VAKYEMLGGSPATRDVVLAFQNLDRSNSQANTFGIPSGLADQLGLKSGRTYNVRNIAAYLGPDNIYNNRRDALLWPGGKTRAQIENEGVFVSLNAIPSTDAAWSTTPFEAQYLKVYDTTAPNGVAGIPSSGINGTYTIGSNVTFTWSPAAVDSEGLAPKYLLHLTINGQSSTVLVDSTSYSFSVVSDSQIQAAVQAVNPNDPTSLGTSSAFTTPVHVLTSNGDYDRDGQSNSAEDKAGTDPLNANSRFRINSVGLSQGGAEIRWTPAPNRTYTIQRRTALDSGEWQSIANAQTSGVWTDANPPPGKAFYRLLVEIP